jgi:hypothetical protein
MSRTEEDIASRVDISIMQDTTLRAYPASYSEVCDTFRPSPALIPFQRLLLGFIAEIPNEVARARLRAKVTRQRLDTVSIDQQHRPKLAESRAVNKTSKLTQTSIFRHSNPQPQERHFLPGASPGVCVRES